MNNDHKKIRTIEIDFTGCKRRTDVYEKVRVAFDFPDWFGNNLSALWDLISEPRDDHVVMHGVNTLTGDPKLVFEDMRPIFDRNIEYQAHWDCHFSYEIVD